jgi:hypothetical protein
VSPIVNAIARVSFVSGRPQAAMPRLASALQNPAELSDGTRRRP